MINRCCHRRVEVYRYYSLFVVVVVVVVVV